jgi:hypothetical protein
MRPERAGAKGRSSGVANVRSNGTPILRYRWKSEKHHVISRKVLLPALPCFNALVFVTEAWQDYERDFDSLAEPVELSEKCAGFLDRLNSYSGHMGRELIVVACQHLQLFMAICGCRISLKRKQAKWSAFGKKLFLKMMA